VSLLHECRNNRVKGPFARKQRIGVIWIENEQTAAILQNKASAFNRHAGAKAVIQTLYERDNISVLIDCGKVSSVAFGWTATGCSAIRFFRIDQTRALPGILI